MALDRFERFHQSVNPADGAVAAIDGPLDVGLGCEHEADRMIRRLRELCAGSHRGLIGHGDLQAVVIEPNRHCPVSADDLLGDERLSLGIWVVAAKVGHWHVQQLSHHHDQIALVEQAHIHEGLAEPLARFLLRDQRLRDVVLRDQPAPDQQLAKRLGSQGRARA